MTIKLRNSTRLICPNRKHQLVIPPQFSIRLPVAKLNCTAALAGVRIMRTLTPFRCQIPNLLFHRSFRPRAFSSTVSDDDDQSRGGLPRFYSRNLPSSKGSVVRVQDDEFWHMTKVLRLGIDDRVQLFNGIGGVAEGCIQRIDRSGLDVLVMEDLKVVSPKKVKWHVFAAFGSLKGGRADWLVEKCTELGASSITPILSQHSSSVAENRIERLQRVSLAASKQCQRLHELVLRTPLGFADLLSKVSQCRPTFLAAAGANPLMNVLSCTSVETGGFLVVGPEGDFTEEEMKAMVDAGALPVGLGPCRLRVETATIALLAGLMLWSDRRDP